MTYFYFKVKLEPIENIFSPFLNILLQKDFKFERKLQWQYTEMCWVFFKNLTIFWTQSEIEIKTQSLYKLYLRKHLTDIVHLRYIDRWSIERELNFSSPEPKAQESLSQFQANVAQSFLRGRAFKFVHIKVDVTLNGGK